MLISVTNLPLYGSIYLLTIYYLTMIGGQVLPPNYVKDITFKNTSAAEATVTVTFKSGATENYTIAPGASAKAEKDVQHDTWTAVDEVTGFTVKSAGKDSTININDASGVESRNYNIGEGAAVTLA